MPLLLLLLAGCGAVWLLAVGARQLLLPCCASCHCGCVCLLLLLLVRWQGDGMHQGAWGLQQGYQLVNRCLLGGGRRRRCRCCPVSCCAVNRDGCCYDGLLHADFTAGHRWQGCAAAGSCCCALCWRLRRQIPPACCCCCFDCKRRPVALCCFC